MSIFSISKASVVKSSSATLFCVTCKCWAGPKHWKESQEQKGIQGKNIPLFRVSLSYPNWHACNTDTPWKLLLWRPFEVSGHFHVSLLISTHSCEECTSLQRRWMPPRSEAAGCKGTLGGDSYIRNNQIRVSWTSCHVSGNIAVLVAQKPKVQTSWICYNEQTNNEQTSKWVFPNVTEVLPTLWSEFLLGNFTFPVQIPLVASAGNCTLVL